MNSPIGPQSSIEPPVVFISHKSKDAEWAKRLATDLRHAGIHAWLDVWDMPPGEPLTEAMARGISQANVMLLILTRASVQSIETSMGGLAFEVHVGEERRFKDQNFRMYGILREQCNPPDRLRNRLGRWLDFTKDHQYETRLRELVAWLKGEPLGPPVTGPAKYLASLASVYRPVPHPNLLLATILLVISSIALTFWRIPFSAYYPGYVWYILVKSVIYPLPLLAIGARRFGIGVAWFALYSSRMLWIFPTSSWLISILLTMSLGIVVAVLWAHDGRYPFRIVGAFAGYATVQLLSEPLYRYLPQGNMLREFLWNSTPFLLLWFGVAAGDMVTILLWNRAVGRTSVTRSGIVAR